VGKSKPKRRVPAKDWLINPKQIAETRQTSKENSFRIMNIGLSPLQDKILAVLQVVQIHS
jgi:hypothetical protein